MSQNTHTLHLFFQDPIKLKTAQLVYQYLSADNTEEAQRWADKLGVTDLEALWDTQWFNQQVSVAPTHLLLCFDTGTHDDLPLRALEALFVHGLQAAVLEVFYDQVGETERLHFDQGRWVSRKDFFATHPQWRAVVEPAQERHTAAEGGGRDDEGDEDDRYGCSRDPKKPVAVGQMRKEAAQRKKEAEEAAQAFIDMARAMGKSGKSPVQGLIGVLLLRAAFKGLLQAMAFTVVTILLFKGIWLWLGLGLVLAIALPLYYVMSEYKDIHGDEDEDDDDNDAEGGGGDAPQTLLSAGDDTASTPRRAH
ncbi:hypothetical protein [Acidovorax sp. sic0104]|uniref:hypothetical protein n=1 Tax=Acidovorax sp. sic0104 TaxID=2854784 RepID=UPI001C47FA2F|nr:hypothetical protein [Acidovorax sp. sic0104]MBV7541815.1 hypothetical protein [Acidovorax sp. sic0104]